MCAQANLTCCLDDGLRNGVSKATLRRESLRTLQVYPLHETQSRVVRLTSISRITRYILGTCSRQCNGREHQPGLEFGLDEANALGPVAGNCHAASLNSFPRDVTLE